MQSSNTLDCHSTSDTLARGELLRVSRQNVDTFVEFMMDGSSERGVWLVYLFGVIRFISGIVFFCTRRS